METVNPSTPLRVNGERSRTIKFITLGCKVNQYDTQGIRERFVNAGFKEIHNGRKADIYMINTCTVTSSADRKSRYFIHYSHRQNPKARIIVTGCYAVLDSDEIAKIPGVTHIIKNQDKGRIIEILNEHHAQTELSKTDEIGINSFSGHTRAFLKIQDGCDNFCSYCKVPLVRGKSKSRDLSQVVKEAKELVRNGFKEIVLCGICLGAYGKDMKPKRNLVDVVKTLEKIAGLLRIRLSSIEAGDVSDELIDKMSGSKKLCRHLHIPIQSGDDGILKKMNRNYTRSDYIHLIKKIKTKIPQIAITTDVLVGFPGESEINFKNTIDLIKEIFPLKVHTFPYSPREGTPGYNFKDKVSPLKKRERILRLQDIVRACGLSYKKQFLNKNMDVLVETHSKENKDYWQGYTDNYIKVLVKSNLNLKNQLIRVRLKKIIKNFILAEFKSMI